MIEQYCELGSQVTPAEPHWKVGPASLGHTTPLHVKTPSTQLGGTMAQPGGTVGSLQTKPGGGEHAPPSPLGQMTAGHW